MIVVRIYSPRQELHDRFLSAEQETTLTNILYFLQNITQLRSFYFTVDQAFQQK